MKRCIHSKPARMNPEGAGHSNSQSIIHYQQISFWKTGVGPRDGGERNEVKFCVL